MIYAREQLPLTMPMSRDRTLRMSGRRWSSRRSLALLLPALADRGFQGRL